MSDNVPNEKAAAKEFLLEEYKAFSNSLETNEQSGETRVNWFIGIIAAGVGGLVKILADGKIQEYQVTSVTIFPGGNGLLSEIIFNVKTTDPTWTEDGGTPADDNWINGKCYRFDFLTTDIEYQLKNKRLCG